MRRNSRRSKSPRTSPPRARVCRYRVCLAAVSMLIAPTVKPQQLMRSMPSPACPLPDDLPLHQALHSRVRPDARSHAPPAAGAVDQARWRHGQWYRLTPGARGRRRPGRARLAGARTAAVRIRRVHRRRRRRGPAQRHRDPAGRHRARHQHARPRRRQRGHRTARDGQRRPGLRAVGPILRRRPGGRIWKPAPTTTWSSRSCWPNSWHG